MDKKIILLCAFCSIALSGELLFAQLTNAGVKSFSTLPERSRAEKSQLKRIVDSAFSKTHNGFSTDEVMIDNELYSAFQSSCRSMFTDGTEFEFNWTLFNLRKAGKLSSKASKRKNVARVGTNFSHAAEIAIRTLHDKYGVSSDRVMADPLLRGQFDRIAEAIVGKEDPYRLRKAALGLRKARRLRPELIVRIADWGREVQRFSIPDLAADFQQIPEKPGVYIFSDSTGYLYIGEASDLRERLSKHLSGSDSKSLANYLSGESSDDITIEIHCFASDSKAKSKIVRRAYESELIRSRNPRFNIAP